MLNKKFLFSSSSIKNIDGYYYTKLTIGGFDNNIFGFDSDGSVINNSNITPPIEYFDMFFLILDEPLYDYIQAGSPTEYGDSMLPFPEIKIKYDVVDYSKPAVIINGYGFYKDDHILTPSHDNSPEAIDKYQKTVLYIVNNVGNTVDFYIRKPNIYIP